MAETDTNNDAGRTRRLPSWMLGQCNTNRGIQNKENNATCLLMENKCRNQGEPNADYITRKLTTDKEEPCRSEDSRVTGLRNNARLNKSNRDAVSVRQKKNPKYGGKMRKLERSLQRGENEIELTVEDLINIAKEYVNADREQHGEMLGSRNCKGETHQSESSEVDPRVPPKPVGCIGYEVSTSSIVRSNKDFDGGVKVTHAVENISSSTTAGRGVSDRNNKFIHDSGSLLSDIKKSGDAAQDMLNLFLGPLLLKTSSVDQDPIIS